MTYPTEPGGGRNRNNARIITVALVVFVVVILAVFLLWPFTEGIEETPEGLGGPPGPGSLEEMEAPVVVD